MSDKEVLEKAFSIVSANGYKGDIPLWDDQMQWWYVSDSDGGYEVASIMEIIFTHDFAKLLWGDEWQYHLQQLAITPPEDRINYLRENMPK